MLNNKKIKVMTKLSIMEKDKEKFETKNYYIGDYIHFHLLKVIVRVTVGYGLILVLMVLYHAEYLVASAVTLDYRHMGENIAGIYFLLLIVYSIGSFFFYSIQFKRAQNYINRYEKGLNILRRLYREEE